MRELPACVEHSLSLPVNQPPKDKLIQSVQRTITALANETIDRVTESFIFTVKKERFGYQREWGKGGHGK